MQKYVVLSLELHLFFARIMKEHSLFLEAGMVQRDEEFIRKADEFRVEFENLLYDVVKISDGILRPAVHNSGEIVTEFTRMAEEKTEFLTGIPIDSEITALEEELRCGDYSNMAPELTDTVREINMVALNLLDGLIGLKKEILDRVLSCEMFTANYPLLIKHIIREADLYRIYIIALEKGLDIDDKNMRQTELFWNQIMMEHAQFIRGLLDPTEIELINASNDFAESYAALLIKAQRTTDATIDSVKDETIMKTREIRDFKAAGTKGIEACEIQSIILPLLADHVLREANHYLRILSTN